MIKELTLENPNHFDQPTTDLNVTDEQIQRIEKTKLPEIVRIKNREIVTLIASEINGVTEEVRENLPELIDFTCLILERFGIELDEKSGPNYETVALSLAICFEWKKSGMGKKKLYQSLIAMLPIDEKSTLPPREIISREGGTPGVFVFIFAHAYPIIWTEVVLPHLDIPFDKIPDIKKYFALLDTETRREIEKQTLLYVKEKFADDSVVYLDFENWWGDGVTEMLIETSKLLGLKDGSNIIFGGVAWHDLGLIAFPRLKPNLEVVVHEKNHLKNPQVSHNYLGVSLNEAITEYLARIAVWPDRNPVGIRFMFEGYTREIKMLLHLKEIDENLFQDLISRYQNDSLELAKKVTLGLIKHLGLDLYLKLYLAYPHIGSVKETSARNIFLETKLVNKQVRDLARKNAA